MKKLAHLHRALGINGNDLEAFCEFERSLGPAKVCHVNFLLIFNNFKFLRLSLAGTSSFLIRSLYTSPMC